MMFGSMKKGALKQWNFASIHLWGPYTVYVYLTLLELFSSVRRYRVAPLTLQKAKLSALADQTWHCYNLIILVDGWRHHNLLGSGQNLYLGNGQSASWQTALSFLRQCVCVCVCEEVKQITAWGRAGRDKWNLTRKCSAQSKFSFCQSMRKTNWKT